MSSNLLALEQDLVYARWVEEELHRENSDVSEEDHSLVTRSRPSTHLQHSRIHPTFRLWITTRADGQRIIPGQCLLWLLSASYGLEKLCGRLE